MRMAGSFRSLLTSIMRCDTIVIGPVFSQVRLPETLKEVPLRTYILSKVDDGISDSERIDLTEGEMEWIFNSVRLMQERQQSLATENYGQYLTRQDIQSAMGVEPDPVKVPPVDIGEMFREQYSEVTDLREKLVELIGRDLSDG